MATKEVMVSAPLIVLLYDRTFLAGSFRAAWRRRRGYYLSLAATWLLLAWLVARTGLLPRSFGEHADPTYEFTSWTYLVTQVGVIAHYLRQAFWPAGLCLNYCWPAATVSDVLLPAIPVIGLLGLTAWALVKQPAWGFLGAWFFLILAPTSSVLPVLESAAYEHRMYLPLAAVVTGIVAGACLAGQWLARRGTIPPATLRAVGACMAACAAIALGIATFQRNKSYRSDLSIWQDAVAKAPGSYLAHNNLGLALVGRGQADAAIPQFLNALKIKPDCTQARGNLGGALAGCGQADEAITQFRKVLEITPDSAEIHYNLGVVLASRGQVDEAATHFRKALEIQPDFADARRNLEAARTRQQ
jgi:Tfp pilus assembly protein PilF